MKPKSWFLAVAALFVFSLNTLAQVVEPYDARKIAAITLSELQKGSDAGTITGDSVIYDSHKQPILYIFDESKSGFIILSLMADATEMWQRLESGEFAEYGGTKDVLPLLATK